MLKELINEIAAGAGGGATSAVAVAGFRAPLGATGEKGKKKRKVRQREPGLPGTFHYIGEGATFGNFLAEVEDSNFDRADVIAKLKTAAKAAEDKGEDSAGFALEDEKGSMVKVWVSDDQADNFAQALQSALSGADEDEDDKNDSIEIAEVLWKLRKEFDIINVEWGEIPEDEEEPMDLEGGAGGEMGAEGGEMGAEGGAEELGAEGGEEGEGDDMMADGGEVEELGAEEAGAGGEEAAASALTQVIDMMKADAEARKAEAEARTSEANARAATEKVKQEEDVLDMEAYYKEEKDAKSETDRIAKLAKYKHDMAGDADQGLSGQQASMAPGEPNIEQSAEVDMNAQPEMEEVMGRSHTNNTNITRGELADMLLKALRR
jgi:hypothetical protein